MATKTKKQLLKQQGLLNRRSNKVIEPSFKQNPFFDPDDLAQVKYEMVRQVTHEGISISEAARNFGMSRPAFYQAQEAVKREGLMGLTPKKSGPKTRHKLNAVIMRFINDKMDEDDSLDTFMLAELVGKEFSISVHPRSIKRALAAQKKTPDSS